MAAGSADAVSISRKTNAIISIDGQILYPSFSAVSQRLARPSPFFDGEAMTATIRWPLSVNALSVCIPADFSPTNKIFTGIVP
jgi:hypothetical protein